MVLHANDGRSSRIIYGGEERMSARGTRAHEKHAAQFMCNSINKQNAIRFHIAQFFFSYQFVLAHHPAAVMLCDIQTYTWPERKMKKINKTP